MSKVPNGHEVISLFEAMYPKHLAFEDDPIGLQIGSLNKPVTGVLVTLDVNEAVVQEAIGRNANLIIAHHPPIYRPIKKLLTDTAYGRMVELCLKHDIAVYAAHTNVDIGMGGVNDLLAEALSLTHIEVMMPTYEEKLKKLVVFVPVSHADAVRDALGRSGAGHIGTYSHCAFMSQGTGTFRPEEGAQPYIGAVGKLEQVEEVRLETIIPAALQRKAVKAMLAAHPYEEAAYDIYPLENSGQVFGLGRTGYLPQEMTLAQFAEHVKRSLRVTGVRVVGSLTDMVRKVAVVGGDGNKYVHQAKYKGADVYVTGDVYYHTAQEAEAIGLHMIDPGHHMEKVMKTGVQRQLQQKVKEKKLVVPIYASELDTDPFTFA